MFEGELNTLNDELNDLETTLVINYLSLSLSLSLSYTHSYILSDLK